ncbi:MAG: aminodeoxychorismate/anthranilate synthase component II [Elusimicrobia bacterium]|nr:aminodeoxychorismate/anthranilate synthase component II [Elusimicrobiota bacterium]
MILLIDNYDSFTYNLYQYLSELGARVVVRRNDAVTVPEIERRRPAGIVLSPGPGRPEDAGRLLEIAARAAGRVPLLGVCLGHQALAQAFGGRVVGAPRLMHGKTSAVRHDGKGLYRGLANPFTATRYHSLMVEEGTLPRGFRVTARSEDGVVMGIRLERGRAEGVQFHPESVLTAEGKGLLRNFLEWTR